MSKDTPEVGDVWLDKETHFRMVCVMVSDYYCEYIEHYEKLCESFDVYQLLNIKSTSWQKRKVYLGKSKANIDDLFKTEEEEEWTPLSKLGNLGIDFDLIPSNEFLKCVKVQGFIDDDGDGYPVIKTDDGLFLYNKKMSIYPSEVQNKDKLDFDYIAWFNK